MAAQYITAVNLSNLNDALITEGFPGEKRILVEGVSWPPTPCGPPAISPCAMLMELAEEEDNFHVADTRSMLEVVTPDYVSIDGAGGTRCIHQPRATTDIAAHQPIDTKAGAARINISGKNY